MSSCFHGNYFSICNVEYQLLSQKADYDWLIHFKGIKSSIKSLLSNFSVNCCVLLEFCKSFDLIGSLAVAYSLIYNINNNKYNNNSNMMMMMMIVIK